MSSKCILIHTTDAAIVHCGYKFTALQLFIASNFRKSSKFALNCIVQYLYCCIVIYKWQYINTSKSCVVASLVSDHQVHVIVTRETISWNLAACAMKH